jgi:hypothetical protein
MQLYEKNMSNANIINAFETQIIEVETLFIRSDFGDNKAVVSLHFFYRVKPELAFHSYEYQHKGPIYSGMADITLRAYSWDSGKIANYLKYRQNDDIDLMSSISDSVASAMDAFGDELKNYLKEAGEVFPEDFKPEEKKESTPGILEPFIAVLDGFKEIFSGFSGGQTEGTEKKPEKHKAHVHEYKDDVKHHRAEHFAKEAVWEAYYRYKMGPGNNLYWVE